MEDLSSVRPISDNPPMAHPVEIVESDAANPLQNTAPRVVREQLALPGVDAAPNGAGNVEIRSRRYLGGKARLLPFLHRIVATTCGPYASFADLFAGTGVVAHSFNRPSVRVIANDFLAANAVSLECWLGSPADPERVRNLIARLNETPGDEENYVSEQYGDRYFSGENARKIGAIRDEIDRMGLEGPIRAAALTSLIYAMDRVARTCGHYDAYRRRAVEEDAPATHDRPLKLLAPHVVDQNNDANLILQDDANEVVRRIEADLIYLDPPYNSRQYSDTYHVIENIVRNQKPELVGIARKPPGRPARSRYCGVEAEAAFEDLIMHARCRWILLSYNNMTAGDKRSNAILSDDRIREIMGRRGSVEVHRTEFNSFTAKRELIPGHEERVYVCQVRNDPA